MKSRSGPFITIDGPGGVGKTTIAGLLYQRLRGLRIPVRRTCQPSKTVLGSAIQSQIDTIGGMVLACLAAGDRHQQPATEIIPSLDAGRVVVCDRYLPSSLVLEALDGIPAEIIWVLNSAVRVPDLTPFLRGECAWIRHQLLHRAGGPQNRFQADPRSTARESAMFDAAAAELDTRGWPVEVIDCTRRHPDEIAHQLLELIIPLLPHNVRGRTIEGRSAS